MRASFRSGTLAILWIASLILAHASFAQPPASLPALPESLTSRPIRLVCTSDRTLIFVDGQGTISTRSAWDPNASPTVELRNRTPLLLAVSPDGSLLAVYTREHGVEVVNLWTDAESKTMAANNLTRLTHLEFKSTGDELIGLTESNQVIRWSLDDGEVFATRDVPKFSGPTALAADAELAVGLDDSDGLVVWDFARQVVRSTLEAGGEPIACVAVSRTGRYVAAAAIAEPEQVRLWDASAGHCLRTLRVDGQTKDSLRFTEDDESLIVTDVGGVVSIWQVATGAPLGRVEVPESARQTFAVDARGEKIAMQQPDGTIALSDIES